MAHKGVVAVDQRDQRYCSDEFEIRCNNGERVRVAFTLDCCDRRSIAFAATTAGISSEIIRNVKIQTLVERFGPAPGCPSRQSGLATKAPATSLSRLERLLETSASLRGGRHIARRRATAWPSCP